LARVRAEAQVRVADVCDPHAGRSIVPRTRWRCHARMTRRALGASKEEE
jgi:hypothetical protein